MASLQHHLAIYVTGASRGLGRALAVEFARSFGACPCALSLVCFARDARGLAATAAAVSAAAPSARVHAQAVDLAAGGCAGVEPAWRAAAAAVAAGGAGPPTRAILLHAAGSLGPLGPLHAGGGGGGGGDDDGAYVAALRAYVDLNLTSTVLLTRLFLRGLPAAADADAPPPPPPLPHHLVVNVSSLAAVQAMPSWGMYAVTRAARDMLASVVAADDAAAAAAAAAAGAARRVPVKTLSYAPGPCDTDMQRECRESPGLDPGSRAHLAGLHASGTLVDPSASAAKCARLVRADAYASGAHIDFYDGEA
jgi:sepiapterin reductase